MSSIAFPTKASTLSFISFAALLVNVIANIFQGFTPFCIKYATLYVNTFVFPLPAPAITRHGPSVCFTASFCIGLSSSNKSFILLAPF